MKYYIIGELKTALVSERHNTAYYCEGDEWGVQFDKTHFYETAQEAVEVIGELVLLDNVLNVGLREINDQHAKLLKECSAA